MYTLPKGQAATIMLWAGYVTDHTSSVTSAYEQYATPLTGLSLTAYISKAAGAFAAPSGGGALTEVANGWYKYTLSATDTNTAGPLCIHVPPSLQAALDLYSSAIEQTYLVVG